MDLDRIGRVLVYHRSENSVSQSQFSLDVCLLQNCECREGRNNLCATTVRKTKFTQTKIPRVSENISCEIKVCSG